MDKLHFEKTINAPAAKVYDAMLGLSDKSTYEQWTAMFNPTSTFEGNWEKGTRIRFTGTDKNGDRQGILSEVAENDPQKFVSLKHIGLVSGDKDITEGPDVEKWTGGFENYTFEESNGQTLTKVDVESTPEFTSYMNETFPKALDKLKEICER